MRLAPIGCEYPLIHICDASNFSDKEKYCHYVLRTVRKEKWDFLNELGIDLIFEVDDKEDGDTGPVNEWGLWYRLPTEDEVKEAIENYNNQDKDDNNTLLISPKRKKLQQDAYNSMKRAA